jgi:CRISPR-associated endonuclease Csn1
MSNKNYLERKMIPVAIYEIAKVYKDIHKFDIYHYLYKFYPNLKKYSDTKLLKIGQKVIVLKDDNEYNLRNNIDFQLSRMYIITQFKYDGSKILLKHHQEAQSKSDIDKRVKKVKSKILSNIEHMLNIKPILENERIESMVDRKKDLEKRENNFDQRLKIIKEEGGEEITDKYKEKIKKFKTESSKIIEGEHTPILGLSRKNWNFLFEGYDFEMDILGRLKWLNEI